MTPDRLLMLVAADANQHGYTVPQLGTDQARQAAERLIAAVGLTRPEPPRQLAASPVDSQTQLLPTLDGRRRGYREPVREYKGYGS